MDLAQRKVLYKRCDPFEALAPGDPRYVDLDAPGSHLRGESVVDLLATRLELAAGPEVAFLTGLPGCGKSTELARLAARLADAARSNALVVRANAEDWMDMSGPVELTDLVLMLLSETELAVTQAARGDRPSQTYFNRLNPYLRFASLEEELVVDPGNQFLIRDLAANLRANPSFRLRLREFLASRLAAFFLDVANVFASLRSQSEGMGYKGIVLIVDSLEKLRSVQSHAEDVLGSAERMFGSLRTVTSVLPGPVVFTVPSALAFRLRLDNLHFLPMIRVRDRDGRPAPEGMDACRALVSARVSPDDVAALFGSTSGAVAVDHLIGCAGGNPRELVRLLRSVIAAVPNEGIIASATFKGVIQRWMEGYQRAVPHHALEWLGRVSREKRLVIRDDAERALAEQMLVSGLLVHYREAVGWWDVHPAIEGMLTDQEPSFAAADTGAPGSSPRSPEPHQITRLALTNVGPFSDLSLDLRPGWNVLLGDNGCGKTSVLRAIGLALAGTDPRAAVASQRQLRAAETTGAITITTDRGKYSTSLGRLPTEVRTTAAADTLTQQGRWLTLAFPAIRGLSSRAISGPTSVTPPVPGAHDLLPLLEGAADSRLDDTRQWIVNTALRVDSNEPAEIRERHGRLLARWFSILRELMPGLHFEYDRVDRESWQVLVKTADGTIPIEQLSQGMVSTIGWIGTLLRRLYEAFPDSAEPELEHALVLVDEIDAHLHPTWQRRIVPLVRAQFPNVQVIATSHSPLIASNLEPDELIVFRRADDGRITAARVDEPLRGYRADQVLTSDAFGLDTTRSEYAMRLLKEYSDALAEGADTPETRARLADLTARVRREIPSPPETIEERRAQDDAMRETDEAVKAQLEASTPEQIERLEALVRTNRPPAGTK